MVNNPAYSDYKKVWVFKDRKAYEEMMVQYPNTYVVDYSSRECYKFYAKAKYWVSNSNLRPQLLKRKSQYYIQTWHGTPFKRIGCDLEVNDMPITSLKEIA